MRWWLLWCLVACGAATVKRPVDVSRGDAALLEGCYDCLVDARAIYRAAGARERELEADLLIALRDKELGLPPSGAIDDARRLASGLPHELEAARYVAIVDGIPSDAPLAQRDQRAAMMGQMAAELRVDDDRALLASGRLRAPVRAYLRIALDCTSIKPKPPGAVADAPLLAYRAETCGFGKIASLTAIRSRVPRFVETSLFIAQIELAAASQDGPRQAKEHLADALARFPSSTTALMMMAIYHRTVGDYASALAVYDAVLARVLDASDALLGRTVCLGALGRRVDAIAVATKMIALDDHVADAYYQRASNHYALGHLAEARADVDVAKQRAGTPELLSLAGVIEHDQGDLDPALADLGDAISADSRDCTARWYLGLVRSERKTAAGPAFEDAMTCFEERAVTTAERIRATDARGDLDADYRRRQHDILAASVVADTHQQHVAAVTAAMQYASAKDVGAARRMLEQAGDDPELGDRIAKLRNWLAHQPR